VLAAALLLAGCSSTEVTPNQASASPDATGSPSSADPSSPTATTSETATTSSAPEATERALPPVTDPVSLPALMRKDYDGRRLRLRRVLLRTEAYTRHAVTYRSGDLRISGILNRPAGRGPFPALVLLHGYIDPDIYVTGQGLMREQDYLAREGYVVLHVDYRNHAGSDDAPGAEERLRLGYTEDAINAVLALRGSDKPWIDPDRIGILGRSMGGGVVYNVLVTAPGLVDAAVAFAPVSSRTEDNFNRWIRDDRSTLAERILRRHGEPAENPGFWDGVSPRTYFSRVTEPLLVHHGTSDDSCPIRWSRQSVRAMEQAGKDVRYFVYEGEEHAFGPQWPKSMRRTVRFFDQHLRAT
jgi:dipeptidyl aminopeptidase/acylaminoacyl peptidase